MSWWSNRSGSPPAWKEKNLDYEIETTSIRHLLRPLDSCSWKEKNLDYEIETRTLTKRTQVFANCLKRKEPRLRDWNAPDDTLAEEQLGTDLKRKEPRLRDWNEKEGERARVIISLLEKKRTSITRLKHGILKFNGDEVLTWKEKNLDYEIETDNRRTCQATAKALKRKEPRLRDWNNHRPVYGRRSLPKYLKRKEPRLRDWNLESLPPEMSWT